MKLPATTTCVRWCMMVVVLVAVVPSFTVGYTNVTFELKNGLTGYSNFLTRFRNAVEAPTRPCGIQSTRGNPPSAAAYIYVRLQISNTQWVTLGIDAKDLYVWAYQDNTRNSNANFLDDSPQAARNSLFPGSTRRITRFGGNYNSLERAAGVTRMNLALGIKNLEAAIISVYGKQESQLNQGTAEARFFLIAIQMVAEAARFKFMETGIVQNDNSVVFKTKMVAFQNNWDRISIAIHKAEGEIPKCTNINPPLTVNGFTYTQVNQIKNDMGILKYK